MTPSAVDVCHLKEL